jgi:hypothetical protein
MPLSEPESENPFGKDILEFDVYQSQVQCLREAIAQYREEEIRPLDWKVQHVHMLVYLGEMETHTLIEALNGQGLNGRIVWQETLKAFQRLHGKEEDD